MKLDRHHELDAQLRDAIQRDKRITHALAYGSFTQGSADEFSDLEYWIFLEPDAAFEVREWLEQFAPVLHFVVNEFGTPNAILPGLLRLELHAVPNTQLAEVAHWGGEHIFPAQMLVKDSDGQLRGILNTLAQKQINPPDEAQPILDRTLNWLAFGLNVLARGERLRAASLLWWVQGGVLKLACLQAGHTEYWLSPARLAERRLDQATLQRLARITAGIDDLERAYAEALEWTLELAESLGLKVHPALAQDLQERAERIKP